MKIEKVKYLNDGSSSLCEFDFKIGDKGFIIDLITNKLYSDPQRAITREIASNARDAHREAGKPDLPIKIFIPSKFSNELKIKDFGLGISPSRIQDVYTGYGNSTKRDSNLQTGGFGLGAKTPLAYTSQFSVKTITKIENDFDVSILNKASDKYYQLEDVVGKHLLCLYIISKGAMADGSGAAKLMHAELTDEETGTEVTIPVDANDISSFNKGIDRSTYFWKVRPEIHGNFTYQQINIAIESGNWFIFEDNQNAYGYCSRNSIVIIDGIQYPLDFNIISKINYTNKTGTSVSNIINNLLLGLYFDNGEIELTPSRENILYTDKTIQVISDRLKHICDVFEQVTSEKLNSEKTYYEAAKKAKCILKSNMNIGSVRWQDNKLYFRNVFLQSEFDNHVRIDLFSTRSNYVSNRLVNKLSISRRSGFNSLIPIFINDIGSTNKSEIINAIEKELESDFQVIVFTDFKNKDSLVKRLKDSIGIDFEQICYGRLSDYKDRVNTTNKPGEKQSKYSCVSSVDYLGSFRSSEINIDSDSGYYLISTNTSGIYRLYEDSEHIYTDNLTKAISFVSDKLNGKTIYIVSKTIASKLKKKANFKPLGDLIKDKLSKINLDNKLLNEISLYLSINTERSRASKIVSATNHNGEYLLKCQDFDKLRDTFKKIEEKKLEYLAIKNAFEVIGEKIKLIDVDIPSELNYIELEKMVLEKYPIFKAIEYWLPYNSIAYNTEIYQNYIDMVNANYSKQNIDNQNI